MKLYMLEFTDAELSYDGHSEDFFIGIFKTSESARNVAEYYLKNVKGFCEYPVTYRIKEKVVIESDGSSPKSVWMTQGWNTNSDFDEVDVIESNCFVSEVLACADSVVMKAMYQRDEWALNEFHIGKTEWCEGFVRMP